MTIAIKLSLKHSRSMLLCLAEHFDFYYSTFFFNLGFLGRNWQLYKHSIARASLLSVVWIYLSFPCSISLSISMLQAHITEQIGINRSQLIPASHLYHIYCADNSKCFFAKNIHILRRKGWKVVLGTFSVVKLTN